MLSLRSIVYLGLSIGAGSVVSGCATRASASPAMHGPSVQLPIVVALAGNSGKLEYWPFSAGGHPKATAISGFQGQRSGGIAANGSQVVVADGNSVVVFNVQTNRQTVLPDPAGIASDVAIGKTGTIYVSNATHNGGNIVVYPSGGQPRELQCPLIKSGGYIAVDNEGDIFLNAVSGFNGVVEIPSGARGPDATQCTALHLNPGVSGYAAGVAIDPKTDNLLVLDDPDFCAGGVEGRLTTYRKPYENGIGSSIDVGQNCSGTLRLDARSNVVFVGDTSVDESSSFIIEASYPGGKRLGAFSGGNPQAFTTLPNVLPN